MSDDVDPCKEIAKVTVLKLAHPWWEDKRVLFCTRPPHPDEPEAHRWVWEPTS